MLLEVLIGMLLFLIGIMGIMSLQAVSMKHAIDAKYRTEASYLTNQIIGRMWADVANLGTYAIAANTACPGNPVSQRDLWLCSVKITLPNASDANAPTIVINGSTVTITVRWQKEATDDVHNHTVVTDISQI